MSLYTIPGHQSRSVSSLETVHHISLLSLPYTPYRPDPDSCKTSPVRIGSFYEKLYVLHRVGCWFFVEDWRTRHTIRHDPPLNPMKNTCVIIDLG